jgi:hypothetical protein
VARSPACCSPCVARLRPTELYRDTTGTAAMSSRAGNGPKIHEPLVRATRVSWFAGALRRPHKVPWPGKRLGVRRS